jgi:hypothetical protein
MDTPILQEDAEDVENFIADVIKLNNNYLFSFFFIVITNKLYSIFIIHLPIYLKRWYFLFC